MRPLTLHGRVAPAAALLLACGSTVTARPALPETEPNDTKAAANVIVPPGGFCSPIITGVTTGTSTTVPGTGSADCFRVTVVGTPGIITEHVWTLSSPTAGHTFTLRGLTQTGGVIAAGSDTTLQTAVTSGTDRVCRFYTLGASQDIYCRITGTASTTSAYFVADSCATVTPIVIPGVLRSGAITVAPTATADASADIDFWVYDSSFNALPDFGHDDNDNTGTTRTLSPGTYYIAFGNFNTANNLASPADDLFRGANVTDFPGVVFNSSTTTIADMGVQVLDAFGTTLTGVGAKTAAYQIVWYQFTVGINTEVEPNETKAAANAVTLSCGDRITGTTTGTSTTVAGAASADTYLLTTPAAAPGIYLNTLTLTSPTPGHSATLRALNQSAGVPIAGTDSIFQTGVVAGVDRVNRFYSFGSGGRVYYRVSGAASTTAPYTTTLTCTPVTPIPLNTVLQPGPITVRPTATADAAADQDFWVYDSSFNPLPDFGHDDVDATGATRTLGPGTYYVAFSNFNTANNLGSPPDDAFRSGSMLDFAGIAANSSTTTIADMGVEIVDGLGTVATGVGAKGSAFEIVWYQFNVVATGACCCGSTCSLTLSGACTGTNQHFVGAGSVCNLPGNNTSPCCKADYNQSGVTSVQDIFDFLAAYFGGDACTDINSSGPPPSVQDIFDFLAAYFAGCA